jgi:hypothetical protein
MEWIKLGVALFLFISFVLWLGLSIVDGENGQN